MHRFVGTIRLWTGCTLLGLSLFAGACAHGEPFDFSRPPNETPLDPTPPVRLTLNPREDQFPAWMPDGSGLIYSYFEGRDGCLAELPPTGGQIRRTRCYQGVGSEDSVDAFSSASPRNRNELAWVEQHSFQDRVVPDYGSIMLGSLDPQVPATQLVRLPYLASSGAPHVTATSLRWLSADRLAYIGNDLFVRRACQGCKLDTILVPEDVVLLDRGTGTRTLLPNSTSTTSIWPNADSTGLYYTVLGDTRVWQRDLLSGAGTPVHDFGSFVDDVSLAGSRLVATLGNGSIATYDLGSGAVDSLAVFQYRYRRPVLSPDGRHVAAEGYFNGSLTPDLWLFTLP